MQLISVGEAAKQTRTSVGFWRTRIFRKENQFVKLGRRVLIPQKTVDELVRCGLVQPKTAAQEGS